MLSSDVAGLQSADSRSHCATKSVRKAVLSPWLHQFSDCEMWTSE